MQRAQSNRPPPPVKQWKYCRYLKNSGKGQSVAAMIAAALPLTPVVVFLFVVLSIFAVAISVPWINTTFVNSTTYSGSADISIAKNISTYNSSVHFGRSRVGKTVEPPITPSPPSSLSLQTLQSPSVIPFSCPEANQTNARICRAFPPSRPLESSLLPPLASPSCPEYFRWIHEDLRPWHRTGITREMLERAARTANFRLVVRGGRAFIQRFRPSFQTRDVFTLWGVVQLLRRYPGRLPDLELMFDTVDWPVVKAVDYRRRNSSAPPPLFRYCGDDSTLDIVFPDWSFWGWPEINIKPWENLKSELKEANKGRKWIEREPYAYWKGNPAVAAARQNLLRCNISESHDWNARIYSQDWHSELHNGYKESNLSSQCMHRYKIYIEGSAWSVSEKYILACDSMALVVKPRYYDFFTRGLMPVQHYWPIRDDAMCMSIKFAVDWANSHKRKAEAIGKEASDFINENLKMDYVYDYMFHLLNEYAKLQRFRPTKPRQAVELCAETLACPAQQLTKQFMMESLLNSSHSSPPCSLPPPFTLIELKFLQKRKANSIKQVQIWEQKAWEIQNSKN